MVRTILILILAFGFAFSQTDVSADTTVTQSKWQSLKDENKQLKKEVKKLKKKLNKLHALSDYRKAQKRISEMNKKYKRVYYVVCNKDTAKLHKKFKINFSPKWDTSRASLDSLCRVIEMYVTPESVKQFKKAKKKGLIKEFGVWNKSMKRLYKYLNDPTNGFIEKEVK